MQVAATTLPAPTPTAPKTWRPAQLRLLAHEYGVSITPLMGDVSADGRRVWEIINSYRASGHGSVLPLAQLRRRVAGRWYGATRPREWHAVKDRTDERICALLNDPNSGILVVPLVPCRCRRAG